MSAGSQAVQNLLFVGIPCAIYGMVARLRFRLGVGGIAGRLGLKKGQARGRAYLYALLATGVEIPLVGWITRWTGSFKGSMLAPYVHATPTAALIGAALTYAFVTTGFSEELLFRGLIGGALLRHLSFWTANTIQAVVFLLPHLLILLVAPQLWFLLILPFILGFYNGWLRHTSGSIWPGVVVHAGGNLAGALAVMDWIARQPGDRGFPSNGNEPKRAERIRQRGTGG